MVFLDIDLFNKRMKFTYEINNEKLLTFYQDEKFGGVINFKPFYFSTNLNFDYISQKKIYLMSP